MNGQGGGASKISVHITMQDLKYLRIQVFKMLVESQCENLSMIGFDSKLE